MILTIDQCRAGLASALGEILAGTCTVRAYPPQAVQPATAWIELTSIDTSDAAGVPYGQALATWRITATARPGMSIADATTTLDAITQSIITLDVPSITVEEYATVTSDSLAAPVPAVRATIHAHITRKDK